MHLLPQQIFSLLICPLCPFTFCYYVPLTLPFHILLLNSKHPLSMGNLQVDKDKQTKCANMNSAYDIEGAKCPSLVSNLSLWLLVYLLPLMETACDLSTSSTNNVTQLIVYRRGTGYFLLTEHRLQNCKDKLGDVCCILYFLLIMCS